MGYEIQYDMSIPGRGNLTQVRYNLAHESGNDNNRGRGAIYGEVKYMKANQNNANTTHWAGVGYQGEAVIIQLAPVGKVSWGCAGANPYCYAQVELARTDNQADFNTGYRAYVWLLRMLTKEAGLPLTLDSNEDRGVKTHYWASMSKRFGTDHTDPYAYFARFGISKEQFRKDIENGIGDDSAPVSASTSNNGNTYTVFKGDTLYGIAKKKGLTVDKLKSLNGLTSNTIKVGQVLKVSATVTPAPTPIVVPVTPVVSGINWITEYGTFYPNQTINVRNAPNTNSTIVAQYTAGQSVRYNAKYNDGTYTWLRYTAYSGATQYLVCKKNGVRWGKVE